MSSRKTKRVKKRKTNLFGWLLMLMLGAAFLMLFNHLNNERSTAEADIVHVADAKAPTALNKTVEAKTNELIEQAAAQGITMFITDGFRSSSEQDQLYAKGRTVPGNVVTQARGGESYHNYGLAVDFALKNAAGQPIWDMAYDGNGNGKADWMEVVDLAKDLGFDWGGDWPGFKDYPHLQMDFGLSISQLKAGYRPKGSE